MGGIPPACSETLLDAPERKKISCFITVFGDRCC